MSSNVYLIVAGTGMAFLLGSIITAATRGPTDKSGSQWSDAKKSVWITMGLGIFGACMLVGSLYLLYMSDQTNVFSYLAIYATAVFCCSFIALQVAMISRV